MKKILTKGIITALAISILVMTGGCAKETKKKIVVGTSADYPPYEFHANIDGKDTIVGFDIDIAKEIAKDMDAELEIKDMDFDGLLPALAAGKFDMVIAGMTPDEDRKKSADFSKIYYNATHGVVMKKEVAGEVKSLEDLTGKVVGVQQGSIQAKMAKEQVKDPKEIKEVPKITDLILMLQAGKVDAIVMEKPVAQSYANTNDDIALTAVEVKDEAGGSAVAIKKGNSEVVKKVDETIGRLLEEGKVDKFFAEANKLAEEQKE